MSSKYQKIPRSSDGVKPKSGTSPGTSATRDEIADMVRQITELSGKKPEKAAKVIQSWLQTRSKKKAA